MNANDFVRQANQFADISRAIIRQEINRPRDVTVKSDSTPVTPVDQQVELALRAAIKKAFPQHGIVGEEYDDEGTDSDYVWILDPIDGTMSFVAGMPTFATLIALTWRGAPILGIMDSPFTMERWVGVDGIGTTLNDKTIRSRSCNALTKAFAQTSSPLYFTSTTDIAVYDRMVSAVEFLIYGGGCQAVGRVAQGYIDVAFETAHDIHDYLALVPIINNAGGVISDWQGKPLTLTSGTQFVASGDQALHRQAIEILNTH